MRGAAPDGRSTGVQGAAQARCVEADPVGRAAHQPGRLRGQQGRVVEPGRRPGPQDHLRVGARGGRPGLVRGSRKEQQLGGVVGEFRGVYATVRRHGTGTQPPRQRNPPRQLLRRQRGDERAERPRIAAGRLEEFPAYDGVRDSPREVVEERGGLGRGERIEVDDG